MSNNHIAESNSISKNTQIIEESSQKKEISQNPQKKDAQSQKRVLSKNLEVNTQQADSSKVEGHDSVESNELVNQLAQLNSSRQKKEQADGKLLEEPNDIDDDLNFSQNTFETKDVLFNIDAQQTETNPKMQQASNNNQIIQNNLEDSLEGRNANLALKNNLANKQVNQKSNDETNRQIKIVENDSLDKNHKGIEKQNSKESNTNNLVQQDSKNAQFSQQNQQQNNINLQDVAKQLQAGKQIKYFPKQSEKEIKPTVNQPNNIQQKGNNQKLITFQAENADERLQYEEEEDKQNLDQQNRASQLQNLQTVQEESNIYQSSKGSIIPPQTYIGLNVNDQHEQQQSTEKKAFDYQQLEGFLKNQKRNLVYPKQNDQQEIVDEENNHFQQSNFENQYGDNSPLINKGNASKNSGLNISSENFKFTVQPIVNSSQFFHQDQRSNNSPQQIQQEATKTNLKVQGNRIMSNSGIKQVGFVDDQQQKNNSQSLQVSEMYQSNFYQDIAPSGKNLSDQTLISITNSSQPSNLINRLSNLRSNQEDFQNDFQQQQPQQKQQVKRFTNLRESMNDDQDIPEELSVLSKNTVQKYMTDQVNIIGSGTSIRDAKRQSTASMLTVESKDMEAATQDQVRKIVTEQVENMIRSKLDGQSLTKQNNLIFNNENFFRQVIREELQNFLKQNANLIRPGSINQLSSPSNSYQNSRIQEKKSNNNNKQYEKISEKKYSSGQVSQNELEHNMQPNIQDQDLTNKNPSPYLNNSDIDNIIDESIQKHQFAQLQNKIGPIQNQQPYFNKRVQIQDAPETTQKQIKNRELEGREFEETKRKTDQNRPGDFPISITSNNQKTFKNQQLPNQSYKEQYLLFKNGIQNEQSRNSDSLTNYTQNHQIFDRQHTIKHSQHHNSHITTENSPQFAVERDSLRLGEISFSINKQQANHLNKPSLLSNESHQSNQHFNSNYQQSKQSFQQQQQQQSRNLLSKQSDYSISSFAPLPPTKYIKSQQDLNMNQQDSQRDTLPDAPFSSAQSPTSFLVQSGQEVQEQKMNYQDLIINPPRRHLRGNSDIENEYHNQNNLYNNNYMMESSIIQRNSEQHQSIESIQNQVFQNQNQGYFNYQKSVKQSMKGMQENQNQQSITQIWEKSLDFQSRGQLNRAYQMLLDIEDDIYLIRMMSITGPCFSKLNQNIGKKLLRRINKITLSQFMDSISFQLFLKIYEQDLLEDLNLEDNQNIKEILYDISGNPYLGEQAAKLYNLIDHQDSS